MKLTRWQRLFILLTALWLPLQAVAGLTMSFDQQPAVPPTAQQTADDHCPYHDAAPVQKHSTQSRCCDNCGVCHLASTGYMPASGLTTAIEAVRPPLQIRPVASLSSHISEPPQYPPKRSA